MADSLESLSPHGKSFVDFFTTDDRPTCIFEDARIVFRNSALQNLLYTCGDADLFEPWIASISFPPRGNDVTAVGWFGGHCWSLKRLYGLNWTVLYLATKPLTPAVAAPLLADVSSAQQEQDEQKTNYDSSNPEEWVIDWTLHSCAAVSPWATHLRNFAWDKTPLGPMEFWSDELRGVFITLMACPQPRGIAWGPEGLMLSNEAGLFSLGNDNPEQYLGQPASAFGPGAHQANMSNLRSALKEGKQVKHEGLEYLQTTSGFLEEANYDIVQLPVPRRDGRFAGYIMEFNETTSTINRERRNKLTADLFERITSSSSLTDLWSQVLRTFQDAAAYVSYAALYVSPTDAQDGSSHSSKGLGTLCYSLEGCASCPRLAFPVQVRVNLETKSSRFGRAFKEAPMSGELKVLRASDDSLPSELAFETSTRGTVNTACVLPITLQSKRKPVGYLVVGFNPRRPPGKEDFTLMESVRDMLSRSAIILALPEEQRDTDDLLAANEELVQEMRRIQAEKTEATLTRMAHHAPYGLYLLRGDGYPNYVNDTFLKFFMFDSLAQIQEISRSRVFWQDALSREAFAASMEDVAQMMKGHSIRSEFTLFHPSADPDVPNRPFNRYILNISAPEMNERGEIIGIVGFIVDISDKKRAEELQAKALEDAIQNKKAAHAFIDMVSHEVRNPLSAMLLLADSITAAISPYSQEPATAETAASIVDAAATLVTCANHQRKIVDDILSLSKLDSDLMVLSPEKTNPIKLAQLALKMQQAEAAASNIDMIIEVAESYRALSIHSLVMDHGRVLQVLINLLGNAVKFTRVASGERRITLAIAASTDRPTWEDRRASNSSLHVPSDSCQDSTMTDTSTSGSIGDDILYLHLAVTDTGRGLTPEELDRLFHRFAQGSARTYTEYGGSGMGLYISKRLIELHGGQIRGQSDGLGKGTTFACFIQVQRAIGSTPDATDSPPAKSSRPSASVKSASAALLATAAHNMDASEPNTQLSNALDILVVEDNRINQQVIAKQLEKLGHTIHVASNGVEALEFLERSVLHSSQCDGSAGPETTPLSLILMDVEMPVMDGLTCTEQIRTLEQTGQLERHIPIVAITANARDEQVERAKSRGVDEVITKPFRVPALVPVMDELVARYPRHGR